MRGLPEFGGELPVSTMAEEILTPGDGRIRAMVTIAGNPVLSTPNGRKLDEALDTLDFMVAVDPYINETTRHADVILPPTPPLERDHYDVVFHQLAVRNTARWNDAVLPKPAQARHDWEIFRDLGRRPAESYADEPPEGDGDGAAADVAAADRRPRTADRAVPALAAQAAEVAGRDRPRAAAARAAGGAAPQDQADRPGPADDPGRPAPAGSRWPTGNDGELLLIGRRHLRNNNSWMHNSARLVKGRPRHQLLMNPDDLAKRDLADGQLVNVSSAAGTVAVEVAASNDMMPGVVSLPHGFGHGRPGARLTVANQVAGASANDVTDAEFTDTVAGTAAVNGVPVTVTAVLAGRRAGAARG